MRPPANAANAGGFFVPSGRGTMGVMSPDELKVGSLGNFTSQTLRAFTDSEIAAIASRM